MWWCAWESPRWDKAEWPDSAPVARIGASRPLLTVRNNLSQYANFAHTARGAPPRERAGMCVSTARHAPLREPLAPRRFGDAAEVRDDLVGAGVLEDLDAEGGRQTEHAAHTGGDGGADAVG